VREHAVGGIAQVEQVVEVERLAAGARRDVTSRVHARRLAEQHVERHVDRRVVEMRVVDDEFCRSVASPTTANGQRSRSQRRSNTAQALGGDGQHVALLRLVAPDLERASCRARRWALRGVRICRRGRRR